MYTVRSHKNFFGETCAGTGMERETAPSADPVVVSNHCPICETRGVWGKVPVDRNEMERVRLRKQLLEEQQG